MNEFSTHSFLKKLKSMFGTRAGKALAVKPLYHYLMKKYLKGNALDFEGFRIYLNLICFKNLERLS